MNFFLDSEVILLHIAMAGDTVILHAVGHLRVVRYESEMESSPCNLTDASASVFHLAKLFVSEFLFI